MEQIFEIKDIAIIFYNFLIPVISIFTAFYIYKEYNKNLEKDREELRKRQLIDETKNQFNKLSNLPEYIYTYFDATSKILMADFGMVKIDDNGKKRI